MTIEEFSCAARALREFPGMSPAPTLGVANKVVGMTGGEPLLHPDFRKLVTIMAKEIPERRYRGLWTGLQWQMTRHAQVIAEAFGFVNNNVHNSPCLHSPLLVAMSDAIEDEKQRAMMIDDCWLQRIWSGTITPKGFFFCEVAGTLDMVFDGPGGLPVTPGCWRRPLSDFQAQIDRWCQRCGIPLNLKGRPDNEERDDISASNLTDLQDSPRIRAGQYVLFDPSDHQTDSAPWRYLR
jgi:hypothetical protein